MERRYTDHANRCGGVVNLLFIQLNPELRWNTLPFVVAYDLDDPRPNKRQWRVDAEGVKCSVPSADHGMKGVWHYLDAGTWQQLTQEQAYAKFPELEHAIEKDVAQDKPHSEVTPW